jgi:hypothetical protein
VPSKVISSLVPSLAESSTLDLLQQLHAIWNGVNQRAKGYRLQACGLIVESGLVIRMPVVQSVNHPRLVLVPGDPPFFFLGPINAVSSWRLHRIITINHSLYQPPQLVTAGRPRAGAHAMVIHMRKKRPVTAVLAACTVAGETLPVDDEDSIKAEYYYPRLVMVLGDHPTIPKAYIESSLGGE